MGSAHWEFTNDACLLFLHVKCRLGHWAVFSRYINSQKAGCLEVERSEMKGPLGKVTLVESHRLSARVVLGEGFKVSLC